jgi:methyl-accepting chemotaxis protein
MVKKSGFLAVQTKKAFENNIITFEKIENIIHEIALASSEQAQGIDLISKGVSEMDKVTQQVAATAEESAAAAEEMNGQAIQMKTAVASLHAVIQGRRKENFAMNKISPAAGNINLNKLINTNSRSIEYLSDKTVFGECRG